MKCRGRTFHRDASGLLMAICTTTQNPPPQNPVPPSTPVSVDLYRNVPESMDMNQTLQAVSVVLKDVLILLLLPVLKQVCIAIKLIVSVAHCHFAP